MAAPFWMGLGEPEGRRGFAGNSPLTIDRPERTYRALSVMIRSRLLWCVLALGALGGTAATARAQLTDIEGLYTTGVRDNGNLRGDDAADSHYVVTAIPGGAPANNLGNSRTVTTLDGGWTANTGTARWITTKGKASSGAGTGGANVNRVAGDFDYTLTFDMPVGAQLATVYISGTGAADNSATIYVNGVLVAGQSITGAGSTNSFSLNASNASFVSGSNTITFRVNNTVNGPSGLFIGSFSGTVVVPEMGAFLPAAGALAVYGAVALRRRWRLTGRR
jgi:hypothetical protein